MLLQTDPADGSPTWPGLQLPASLMVAGPGLWLGQPVWSDITARETGAWLGLGPRSQLESRVDTPLAASQALMGLGLLLTA